MTQFHPEFVVDDRNRKKAVLIPYAEWEQILEALEDLEDIRAYDRIKSRPSEAVPFEEAVRDLDSGV